MISETPALQILLVVASLSGNTRQLARLVAAQLQAQGHQVQWQEADERPAAAGAEAASADLVLLGTWTDNAGRTPSEMKAWVAAQAQPLRQVAVFGTGETQWGQEYYCGAVDRLQRYYRSSYPALRIEQMPHGTQDARAVVDWTAAVLSHYRQAVAAAATTRSTN